MHNCSFVKYFVVDRGGALKSLGAKILKANFFLVNTRGVVAGGRENERNKIDL